MVTFTETKTLSGPLALDDLDDVNTSAFADGNGILCDTVSGGFVCGPVAPVSLFVPKNIQSGRLTATSNVPVTLSDVVSANLIYFTPYDGNQIALYNGTSWSTLTFTQLSISLASGFTSGKPYDVFAYNNAGAVALETLVWTNDTTRATALAQQDGVYVKSGATTRRYLGTFYTTSATTTEDSAANRLLYNYYHRKSRTMKKSDSTSTWTYTTQTTRIANNNSANKISFFVGVSEDEINAQVVAQAINSTSTFRNVLAGIGLDSAVGVSEPYAPSIVASVPSGVFAFWRGFVAPGFHYLAWLEQGAGADTQTWYGTTAKGIFGTVQA